MEEDRCGIVGINWSYKAKKTCWKGLTESKKTQKKILRKKTKSVHYCWNEDELNKATKKGKRKWKKWKRKRNKKKKGKKKLTSKQRNQVLSSSKNKKDLLKVVDSSDVIDHLEKNHPKLMPAAEQEQILTSMMQYAIGTQVDELYPAFMQYCELDKNLNDKLALGLIYKNEDCIN